MENLITAGKSYIINIVPDDETRTDLYLKHSFKISRGLTAHIKVYQGKNSVTKSDKSLNIFSSVSA